MSLPLWEECAWFRPEDLDPVTVTESGTVKDSLIVADSRAVRDSNTVNDLNTFPDAVSTIDSSTVIDSSALTNEVLEEITNTIASGSLLGSDKVVEGSEGTPKESKETPTTGTTEEVADSAAESANCQTSDRFDDPFGVVITTCTPKDSKLVHDLSARVSDIGIVEEAVDRPKIRPIVFPCRPDINKRIFLHCGDAYKIPCDCLAIGQNEQLNEKSDGNESIYLLAGPTIEEELLAVGRIQTGEAIITKSGNLPCDYVIHAVGPKFDKRYLTASDHALFSAYKTTLLLAAAQGVKSLVIKTLYHKVKKYPRFEAAHVALRAIRKFLNHSIGDVFERIMICVDDEDDYEIYKTLMIGYFPRNSTDLESQGIMLPSDEELGDEWGEIFIKDRAVTITAGPRPIAPKPSIAGNIENDDNSEGRLSNGSTTNGSTGRSRAASSDIKTGYTSHVNNRRKLY